MPLECPNDCPKICCSIIIPRQLNYRGVPNAINHLGCTACQSEFNTVHPIGVFIEKGCSWHLLLNIFLTLLGYIPGLIHALYIIVAY